jgi:ABC-type microcin C transport system permease subunit YejE
MNIWLLLFFALVLSACQSDDEPYVAGLGFDNYVPVYNDYIKDWVAGKLVEAKEELTKTEPGTPGALDAQKQVEIN